MLLHFDDLASAASYSRFVSEEDNGAKQKISSVAKLRENERMRGRERKKGATSNIKR